MKALHDRTGNPRSPSIAADLTAFIAEIFEQYPWLCGFSVQDGSTLTRDRAMVRLSGALYLADVSLNAPQEFCVTREFCERIASMLFEFVEEQPEVFDLLPGRTFARTFH